MKRDEFSERVKQILAGRAGYKCSICEKFTGGLGSTKDSIPSDGIAAHIIAASPNGPRNDTTLSSEQRSSIDNGIWTCSTHGREIDSRKYDYSKELLQGLKKQREERAKLELRCKEATEDHSTIMIEFPYVQTTYRLLEIVSPQQYTRTTTLSLKDYLSSSINQSHILDLASEVIIGTWETHHNVAGILSTILSNHISIWHPSTLTISKMEDLCKKAIMSNDWSQVAAVEPLAFAISGIGHPSTHRNVLERLISSSSWRDADTTRVQMYYGNIGNEIAAIIRHWNDPFREGLLKVNDIGRLIDLLMSNNQILRSDQGRPTLLKLLQDHVVYLKNSGEQHLAKVVIEFLSAFQYPNLK